MRRSNHCFPYKKLLVYFCFLWMTCVAETEVKWTGNPEDSNGSGPLPLSNQQRQQLLQLEQVIRSSPDPEATLKQAADANGMSPQDLMSMLQRNRSDMEQGGGGGRGGALSSTLGQNLGKLLSMMAAVVAKAASQNPRAFVVLITTLLLLMFVAISAPRTGLVLSNQRGLLSRGPTTVFQPPIKFLEKKLSKPKWQQRDPLSVEMPKSLWKDLQLKEDGTHWHSLPRKSPLKKAASGQITIPVVSFLEEDAEEDEENVEQVLETCFNHAVDVLASRKLTEFATERSISLYTLQGDSARKRFAVLVVKKLGDWGRYGMAPLQVTQQQEGDNEVSLTYSTMKGAPFTGQLHVEARKVRPKKGKGAPAILLTAHVAIPRKGNKLSRKRALDIVDAFSSSMVASIRNRTRQSLARQSQSSNFQGRARARAEEKRSSRLKKEVEMEEMAEDRRRKWQRNNPNVGRYRPSGDRMRSPNNC